jgi:hypothetical protein
MKLLRRFLRRYFLTANTLRYRVEWPPLRRAFLQVPVASTLFDGGAGSGEFLRKALVAGFAKNVIALEFDAHLSAEERRAGTPFGILTLFRKDGRP